MLNAGTPELLNAEIDTSNVIVEKHKRRKPDSFERMKMGRDIQTLPSDIEAEKTILGAVLLNNEIINQVVQSTPPETFYLTRHRTILGAMISIYNEGLPIDLVTLQSELLKAPGSLNKVGGMTYIASLIDGVPRTDTIAPYVPSIVKAAKKRRLLSICNNLILDIDELGCEELIERAESEIFALSETSRQGDGPVHVADVGAKLADFYEDKANDPSKLIGLPTGFKDVDARTLGLTPGLTIIAARPSAGKTSWALNIATNVALSGGAVYFTSIESGALKVTQRILASISEVDSYRMRQGQMDRDEWARFADALAQLSIARFEIDDTPDITPAILTSRIRQFISRHGRIDLLLVDYLQLMKADRHYEKRHEEVQAVSRDLVKISRIFDVPVIAVSQLSRSTDQRSNHRPQLSDLRESGSIEQDADLVMFIHREEMYKKTEENRNIATIIFGKQRDGSTDEDVDLVFIKQYTKFADLYKE